MSNTVVELVTRAKAQVENLTPNRSPKRPQREPSWSTSGSPANSTTASSRARSTRPGECSSSTPTPPAPTTATSSTRADEPFSTAPRAAAPRWAPWRSRASVTPTWRTSRAASKRGETMVGPWSRRAPDQHRESWDGCAGSIRRRVSSLRGAVVVAGALAAVLRCSCRGDASDRRDAEFLMATCGDFFHGHGQSTSYPQGQWLGANRLARSRAVTGGV